MSKFVYVLQRKLHLEDRAAPVDYEQRREEAGRLSEEAVRTWIRSDRETLIERRSDVKNILATRVVLIREGHIDRVYEVEA